MSFLFLSQQRIRSRFSCPRQQNRSDACLRALHAGMSSLALTILCVSALELKAQPPEQNEQQTQSQENTEQLPTLAEMNRPPSYDDLIKAEPFDWIVLKRDSLVINALPLQPRPDTLKRRQAERDELDNKRRRTRDENLRLKELRRLVVQISGDPTDYVLKPDDVREIISYEQLMLERADLLIEEGNTVDAYNLVDRVEQLVPDWEQTKLRLHSLLFRESEIRRSEGKPFAALALLRQLHQLEPNYPQVSKIVGEINREFIDQAIGRGDYAEARWHIQRLVDEFPDHPVALQGIKAIELVALEQLELATQLWEQQKPREATRTARAADRIWRMRGDRRVQLQRIIARHQTVRVAVESFDTQSVFPVPLSATRRHRELVELSLFEPEKFNEITYYRSAFIEDWEPRDLGRSVTFQLRSSKAYWQSQPLLTASQLADSLVPRLDPSSPEYDPRLDSFIAGYSVKSPSRIEIRFSRVPLNLAALFRIPVKEAVSDNDQQEGAGSGRFVLKDSSESERSYVRRLPEPDNLNSIQYHIAEIIERKYNSRHRIIQAFKRGEVDVIASVKPWEVADIEDSDIGFVKQLAAPVSHVIVFNPDSVVARSTQLRRALSFAIPRQYILSKVILGGSDAKLGRVSSSPWPSSSYASDPLIESPPFDLRLAFALKFAAEEQLRIPAKQQLVREAKQATLDAGERWEEPIWRKENAELLAAAGSDIKLPKLKILCESDEVMREAAEQMIRYWSRIGFEVDLLPRDVTAEELESWDFLYRRSHIEEPLLDLWPVLLTDETLDVRLLGSYPDWMRQDLTLLDYAGSFRIARDRLFRMQRNMAAQAFLIPLWEVNQYVARRKIVTGFPKEHMASVYHNATRWVVKP